MSKKLSILISSGAVQAAGITPHVLCMRPASLPQPGTNAGHKRNGFHRENEEIIVLVFLQAVVAEPGGSLKAAPCSPLCRARAEPRALCCWDGAFPAPQTPVRDPSPAMGMSWLHPDHPCCPRLCSPPVPPWRCSHPARAEQKLLWLCSQPAANPKEGKENVGLVQALCVILPAGSTFTSSCCCGQQEKKNYSIIKNKFKASWGTLPACWDFWGKLQKHSLHFNVGNSPQCIPWWCRSPDFWFITHLQWVVGGKTKLTNQCFNALIHCFAI